MPDVVYQHIIRCLQDPGHLVAMKAKESERKLCNHLKSLVTRNCRFYLYYTDIKHPVQLGTSVLGPVLYACINSNFEMHPPFPRGEGQPQVVRVIPMSQVEAVIENAFKQFRCRIGAISSFIKQQYACVPDELVQMYRHFSPDMTRHHAITRANKQRLRPIRALYPRARYTLDLVDWSSYPDNSRVIYGGTRNYMVHMIDHATKCRMCEATAGKTAAEVARFLRSMFIKHGRPAILHCDNGGEFIGQEVRDLC